MKTGRARSRIKVGGEMRREYRFDYTKARPNRFVGRFQTGAVAVVLDPDVASVFGSSNRVNRLLRSVIAAMPDRRGNERRPANLAMKPARSDPRCPCQRLYARGLSPHR